MARRPARKPAASTSFTTADARRIFEQAHAAALAAGQGAQADQVRLVAEYLCDPEFRAAMQEHVWQINQAREASLAA